ncbi:hypothetical protein [Micromonospora sp. SL4-19]|uniref:hypothetical protein n=1 Tax=Micromonospora sp. SL4-19 TaxID=3399129 RepID=UPI003A4E1178
MLFSSAAIVDDVAAGELAEADFGSHYYLYDLHLDGEATNVAARFYPGEPVGPLQVTGVGIIDSTGNEAGADAFVDFMLSDASSSLGSAPQQLGGRTRMSSPTRPGRSCRADEDEIAGPPPAGYRTVNSW